jgi:hypothetical protein
MGSRGALVSSEFAHLEHAVWADANIVLFTLAAVTINDGRNTASSCLQSTVATDLANGSTAKWQNLSEKCHYSHIAAQRGANDYATMSRYNDKGRREGAAGGGLSCGNSVKRDRACMQRTLASFTNRTIS